VPAVVAVLLLCFSGAVAVMATVVPPTRLGPGTPADEYLEYREVTFRTGDGVWLSAWFVPSRNGAAVVLRHGAGSTRTSTLAQAGVLGRHGYGVLLVDARGHGRSHGRGMDFGWYGDPDTVAAVTFLTREPGVDPERIGVVGLSMGGEEAIGAAAADRRIRVVVAEGATARTAADKDAWLPGGVPGAVQRGLDAVTFGLADLLTPASSPTELRTAVNRARGTSFLLVTAGEVPDEARAAQALREVAPSRVQVWHVAGAGHTRGLEEDPDGWTGRVTGFLEDHLGQPSS
jgi:pimeloyl-ACP methyl ester carboxylesterase